jgi:hypothetical protein
MPLIANPVLQYVDVDGVPMRFAKAYFTLTRTTDPAEVYQDEEFSTPHTYPVVADANGLFPPVHYDPSIGLLRLRVIAEDGDLADPFVDADFVIAVPGNPSGADVWLGGMRFVRSSLIPSTFAGSGGKKPKANPTSDYSAVVKTTISGVETEVATFTCDHTTGEWTISGTGLDDLLPEDGDELDVYGPADADPAIADFGFTFAIALRSV